MRIFAAAPTDVWVSMGDGSRATWRYYHYDGTAWGGTVTTPPTGDWILHGSATFGLGRSDVWQVGGAGVWRHTR